MLKEGAIDVVVGRIAIDKPIEEKRIDWEPPVFWGREVSVIRPFAPVLGRISRVLVFVEVIGNECFIVWPCESCEREEYKCESYAFHKFPMHSVKIGEADI